MEITKALVLEGEDPLSKALNEIANTGTAVVIVKNGVYSGIIDDRHMRQNISDPGKIRCDSVAVVAPTISEKSSIVEKLNHFMSGHFKALPVVDEGKRPLGIFTRSDFLDELLNAKLIPPATAETVMSSPVISIDANESVGRAKRAMKENRINRLVVLNKGYPSALLSKFDLVTSSFAPKTRQRATVVKEIIGFDNRKIADLVLREIVATAEKDENLTDIARKMATKKISALIVLSNKKPVGVLTANDIFKAVQKLFEQKEELSISGLEEQDMHYYDFIKQKIKAIIERFSKIFTIRNPSVHIKKRKTLYIAKVFLELDHSHVAVGYEEYDLKTAINGLAKELETVLEKKKSRSRNKKAKKVFY